MSRNSIRNIVGWWFGAAFLVAVVPGCAPQTAPGVRRVRSTFAEIRPDGSVHLDDGTTGTLIGVRLRAETETGEPELLSVIASMVRDGGPVDMEIDGDGRAVVCYRQLIYYRELYWAPHVLWCWLRGPWAHVTVNELLIAMGAARHEPGANIGWASQIQERCAALQVVADEARWGGYTYVPLTECRRDPGRVYDELQAVEAIEAVEAGCGWWRPRITLRDNEQRERNLLDLKTLEGEVEKLRATGGDATQQLCEAAHSNNRYLRIYAARVLGEIGGSTEVVVGTLAGLLRDPYRWVRLCAVRSLRQVGAAQARSALEETAHADADALVRSEAEEAIRELGR
jgi:hypothetical protein